MADDIDWPRLHHRVWAALKPWAGFKHTAWWDDIHQIALIAAWDQRDADDDPTEASRVWRIRAAAIDWIRHTEGRIYADGSYSHRAAGNKATGSLSRVIGEDEHRNPITLGGTIAAPDADPADTIAALAIFDHLNLTTRDRFILEARRAGYGQAEIGAMLDVTESRICQILRVIRTLYDATPSE